MTGVYYNELDPFAAEWIRQLIKKKLIADGDVDDRSIKEVSPADLRGYRQCHFFAGIAVWSFALRGAGWSDTREVWTGSCPCQSFSHAGQRKGFDDPRNLWPSWIRLIRECKPAVIFGEQVSAAVKHGWLDVVQTDLETEGYAVGKAVLGACSVGAPHIRQRLYFLAKSESAGTRQDERRVRIGVESGGTVDGLAYSKNQRLLGRRTGATNGFWRDADWLSCTDRKWRPVEPGTFPLVARATSRMVRLRGYGNALNAETAKAFIAACMEIL
jgi:DNA (cytosine-5)-methyltransferase 1